MFEKRLNPQNHALTILPSLLVLVIAIATLMGGHKMGTSPRDTIFDMFQRIDARPATGALSGEAENGFAMIDIDAESIEKVGAWPWPRTELAKLAHSAVDAGAASVIFTIPLDGEDQLSPEVVSQYWQERGDAEARKLAGAVAQLPSHDTALANSLNKGASTVAIGTATNAETDFAKGWSRTASEGNNWLVVKDENGEDVAHFALARVATKQKINEDIANTTQLSASIITPDQDGYVRRARPLWNALDKPVPSSYLAALQLQGASISAQTYPKRRITNGTPIVEIGVNGETINLDYYGNTIFFAPKSLDVDKVPAWRLTSGNADVSGWAKPLKDKTVFIGESISQGNLIKTKRGDVSTAQFHALMADQIQAGVSLERPDWAGYLEAGLALLMGVAAIAAAIFLAPRYAFTSALIVSALLLAATFLTFSIGSTLIDPAPAIGAMFGGQLGLALSIFGKTMLRDDAVRGAFHGALPAATMTKLQKQKNGYLLKGVRRPVTVLSCAIRLPEEALALFVHRPDDLVQFTAHTNDRLRRAILSHGGTVDHGEDGRLLGYWNAPEEIEAHIEKACTCALQMIDDMNILTQDLQAAAFARKARIIEETPSSAFEQGCLEIGLSSDIGFCGPVGRGQRNRYSVIGPAVGFSSLLRSRSSLYGPAIVCDEAVFATMRHHFAFLDLDTLRVNDEKMPRSIFGLVGNPFLKASKSFRDMADAQRDLVNLWREGRLDETQAALKKLENMPGSHDTYTSLFEERLTEARRLQSLSDGGEKPWDGTVKVML